MDEFNATIGLPFGRGTISGTWRPNDVERLAAWQLYVELITRVTVVELGPSDGLLREALTSYYSLFETTRRMLKDAGPTVAQPGGNGQVSLGHLSVAVLNNALRPLLARWHPALEDHETHRPDDVSRLEWEQRWEHNSDLRAAIGEVRTTLTAYAGLLADACDARSLLGAAAAPNREATDN